MQRKEQRDYKPNKNLNNRIFVRIDEETKKALNESAKSFKTTRSDIVRRGIRLVYSSL